MPLSLQFLIKHVVVAQPLLDVPIYGRISSLQLYRPKVRRLVGSCSICLLPSF